MGLETGTQIGDLVPANPPGTDPKSQGDDHLRLIKTCVQGSLGSMAAFWTIPVAITGLSQRNETDDADISLITIAANGIIDIGNDLRTIRLTGPIIGASTIVVAGAATFNAGVTSAGSVVVSSGNLNVQTGTGFISGLLTVDSGGITVNEGDITCTGVSNMVLTAGGFASTAPPNLAVYSIKSARSGSNSGNMWQTENLDAAATFRPLGAFEHRANGDIGIGNTSPLDDTFVIVENTIVLGHLPTSAVGLPSGALYSATGAFVSVAP